MGTAGIRTPDQRLRVFISSTLGELAEERQAARHSVEQLRLTPIMFELGARPHPPGRSTAPISPSRMSSSASTGSATAGWPPTWTISGLEDEFLLSERDAAADLRQAAGTRDGAPTGRDAGRGSKTRTARPTGPSANPAELHDLLLDDLAVLLTERFEALPSDAGAERQNSNLPAPTSTFLGREEALDSLGALLGDRRPARHAHRTGRNGQDPPRPRGGPGAGRPVRRRGVLRRSERRA